MKRKIISCIIIIYSLSLQMAHAQTFTTFQFTENQIKALATVCQNEQGTPKGAAAEASLMANHMDLNAYNARNYPDTGEGLYNYVKYGGWFSIAKDYMDSFETSRGEPLDPEVLNAVKKVLIDGKRILPGYIDEHDCWDCNSSYCSNGVRGDICEISTGSYNNRNDYIQHQTKISTIYGANYIFYSFPEPTSDPFGYTSESNRQRIGDFHYEFDGSPSKGGTKNQGIGGELGGLLTDLYPNIPGLISQDDFTCRNIFYYINASGEQQETGIKKLLDGIFALMKVAAPVAAIALTILDYFKVITANDSSGLKKANLRTIKRLGIAIAILMLPYLLDLLFNIFGLYDLSNCGIT